MRLNKEWEKDWQEIHVPKDAVFQAIEEGLNKQQAQTDVKPQPISFFKKYRKYLATAAVLTLLAGGAYASFRQPKGDEKMAGEAPQEKLQKDDQESKLETAPEDVQTKGAASFHENGSAQADTQFDDASRAEATKSAVTGGPSTSIDTTKIIKTYTLEKETNDFNSNSASIKKAVATFNGYISNATLASQVDDANLMIAEYDIRIPKDQASAFVEAITPFGETVSSTESASDQSLFYSDNQSRIDALSIEEEALLSLLGKSDKIQDMLTIQERLSVIRSEKEGLIRQNKLISSQVAESTIYLTLNEVKKITNEKSSSVSSKVKSNWQEQRDFWMKQAKELAVFLLSNGLYFIILLMIGSFSWFFYRKVKKRGRDND